MKEVIRLIYDQKLVAVILGVVIGLSGVVRLAGAGNAEQDTVAAPKAPNGYVCYRCAVPDPD